MNVQASGLPDPDVINSHKDLISHLDALRQRAAKGTRKAKISLDEIARRSGIPRSTVHAYLSGRLLPPADALDAIVVGLGVAPRGQKAWAEALYRVSGAKSVVPGNRDPSRRVPRLLPPGAQGFVGREGELMALTLRLEGEGGLVVVVGPGGVGKTSLVLEWARRNRQRFPHGQLYADLRGFSHETPPDLVLVAGRFLTALGVPAHAWPSDPEAILDLLRTEVADKQILMFLDNAKDAPHVRPLLPGTSSVTVVITSRDDLRSLVVREGAYRVSLPALPKAESLALLRENSPTLDDATGEIIIDKCAGLPLALRILAERLASVTPDVLLAELDDATTSLSAITLIDEGIDHGIRGVLANSYRNLSETAQEVFRVTGAIPGARLNVAALALLTHREHDVVKKALDEMVATHLIVDTSEEYIRHDLVLAFALECLEKKASPSVIATLREESVAAYMALMDQTLYRSDVRINLTARPVPIPSTEPIPADELLRDSVTIAAIVIDNLDGQPEHVRLCARLAEGLGRLSLNHGNAGAVIGVLERVLARASELHDDEAVAAIALRLASIYSTARGTRRATDLYEEAAQAALRAENYGLLSAALSSKGWMRVQAAQFSAAVDMFREAKMHAEAAHDEERNTLATMYLASALSEQGRVEEAEVQLAECVERYQKAGSIDGAIIAQLNRAENAVSAGHVARAREIIDAAVSIWPTEELPALAGPLHCVQAFVTIYEDKLDEAVRHIRAAKDLDSSYEQVQVAVRVREMEGLLHIKHGRYSEAIESLTESCERAHKGGFECDAARIGIYLAEAHRVSGSVDIMRQLLDEHGGLADRLELQIQRHMRDSVLKALESGAPEYCLFTLGA